MKTHLHSFDTHTPKHAYMYIYICTVILNPSQDHSFFPARAFSGLCVLSIQRQWFDKIIAGEKTSEYREDTSRIKTIASHRFLMLRNGRTPKDPYIVVEILNSEVVSRDHVASQIGQEAVESLFKSDVPIRAIALGRVMEVWDPKRGMFRKGDDKELGWNMSATTSPGKHSMRMPNVGPLPVDLHVQQLKRRPVSSLPTMDLEEASERIIHCLKRMKQDAGSGLLWEGKTIRVGTRFSGIGAVEEGLCILEKHTPSKFQVKYACDIDEDCFNFYRSRFSPSQQFHYFSNVMDVVNVDPTISKLTFLEKQKVVEGLTIKKRAICKCHKKECTIPGVLMDVSGSICKDYSPQGQQKGVEGVHALSMLVHNAELRRRKVPLRISENVVSAEGQKAIASSMSDCDLKYVITMCEDRVTAMSRLHV